MRILQILASIDPKVGGPVITATELSRSIAVKGNNVSLYTTNYGVDKNLDVPLNVPIIAKNVREYYFPATWPRNYQFSWQIARAIAQTVHEYDIVHIHGIYLLTTLTASYFCRKYRVPYVITIHGALDPFLRRKSRFKKAIYTGLFLRRDLDSAAAIHFTSTEEMELVKPVGFKAPGVVVPWGLNMREYEMLPPGDMFRRRYPDLKNKQVILYLGRLNFKKGLDILVRAFSKLVHHRKDLHLVLAGPDNEEYGKKIRQWVSEENIGEFVTFTGMLVGEEKLAAISASDVFVLPSYTENFGITVLESLACGLPVVISNKVNIWREIVCADAGVVVNCNVDELERAILDLINDPARRRRLAVNGKKLVKEQYTWEKTADQMIDVYQNIIGQVL